MKEANCAKQASPSECCTVAHYTLTHVWPSVANGGHPPKKPTKAHHGSKLYQGYQGTVDVFACSELLGEVPRCVRVFSDRGVENRHYPKIITIAASYRDSYFSTTRWLIGVLVHRCRCCLVSPLGSSHVASLANCFIFCLSCFCL